MRKLWRMSESSVDFVKHLFCRFYDRVNHGRGDLAAARKRFRPCDRAFDHLRLFHYVAIFLVIGGGDRKQHAPETGTSIAVCRRKIRSAIKGLAIGSKKRGKWPSALPGERGDRQLVAAVNIWTLVPIYFH